MLELQGYLCDETRIPGVNAVPGRGTDVPLYILGSSLFGAKLAAMLGLPYAFASHFAPQALEQAVAVYRAEFRPSEQLAEPHVIAAINVIAADSHEEAAAAAPPRAAPTGVAVPRPGPDLQRRGGRRHPRLAPGPPDRRHDALLRRRVPGARASRVLEEFRAHADADELMVVHASPTLEARLRSVELTAEAWGLSPAPVGAGAGAGD